jgi:hypothetical protein
VQRVTASGHPKYPRGRRQASLAALLEANARLLDSLEGELPAELMTFVVEAKDQLAREVARERQRETEQDQATDQRFE